MNELELLDRLKIIKEKMDKGEELTDIEYKLLNTLLLGVVVGILKYTLDILDHVKDDKGGDKDERFSIKC